MTNPEEKDQTTEVQNHDTSNEQENKENEPVESSEPTVTSEADVLKQEVADLKDKYIRLYSDFENFRKRTAKEKLELLSTAAEDIIKNILPVMDDLERALKSIGDSEENQNTREGVDLVYQKFKKTLEGKGLKVMESIGKPFDVEIHEAITQIPAPSEDLKGKVIDEIEKGYYLNEKVIRFAKVIIGA
jgi:molecular chaperone GrpE